MKTKCILQHRWKSILLYKVEIWPVTGKLRSKIRPIGFVNLRWAENKRK
jgi:hypothetical protein